MPIAALFLAMLPMAGAVTAPPLVDAARRVTTVATNAGLPGEIVLTDAGGAAVDMVFGTADRERHLLHQRGQKWIWGSVTKQVAALIVMQEVDQGRLALDAPIDRYLPDFGGNRAITIRQLLQHRTGLPDPDSTPTTEGGIPGFYLQTGAGIGDTASAVGYCSEPAVSPPGGNFHYNNCDYLVLGAILHAVTGRSFGDLVEERIARPLKLRSLHLAADGSTSGGAAAKGYVGNERYPAVNVATFGASGALIGTARDLAALDRALMSKHLLAPASRDTLWTGDPALGYQALGVWAFPARLKGCAASLRLIERRGDVGGTQVRNIIAPDLKRAIVVFTNDASINFGEIWQGKGLSYDLLSAAFCPA